MAIPKLDNVVEEPYISYSKWDMQKAERTWVEEQLAALKAFSITQEDFKGLFRYDGDARQPVMRANAICSREGYEFRFTLLKSGRVLVRPKRNNGNA